jgi:hypothetical protein
MADPRKPASTLALIMRFAIETLALVVPALGVGVVIGWFLWR